MGSSIESWLGEKGNLSFFKLLNSLSQIVRYNFKELFDWGIVHIQYEARMLSVQFDEIDKCIYPTNS